MITTDGLWSLNDCIFDWCHQNGIWIDLRWKCFGDRNKFYTNNEEFTVKCTHYLATNLDDVKDLITMYIESIWEYIEHPNNRMVLYIEDIVDNDSWYDVVMGGFLFRDDAGDGW